MWTCQLTQNHAVLSSLDEASFLPPYCLRRLRCRQTIARIYYDGRQEADTTPFSRVLHWRSLRKWRTTDDLEAAAEEGRLRIASSLSEVRFLQPSIWHHHNYYIQLVAIKRNWMRVPNLDLSPKGNISVSFRNESYIVLIGLIPDYLPHSGKDLI